MLFISAIKMRSVYKSLTSVFQKLKSRCYFSAKNVMNVSFVMCFPAVPLAPPQNLTLVNYTSDLVWLKWSPSPVPGGIVKIYSLKIHEHETDTIFYKVGWL